jgi:hypothetical protein
MNLKINNRFSAELPADSNETNVPRQVKILVFVTPRTPSSPRLIHFTEEVAEILGITREEAQSAEFTNIFWKRVAS